MSMVVNCGRHDYIQADYYIDWPIDLPKCSECRLELKQKELDQVSDMANKQLDVSIELSYRISKLRGYIKHLESCNVCNEGLMGMCGERDDLRIALTKEEGGDIS